MLVNFLWLRLPCVYALGGLTAEIAPTRALGYMSLVFAVLAIICAGIAVRLIVKGKHVPRFRGAVKLLTFLGVAGLLAAWLPRYVTNQTLSEGMERRTLANLLSIRTALDGYVEDEQRFPSADSWCDAIAPRLRDEALRVASVPDVNCIFAFNENLSARPAEEVPHNTVLVIEADGPWNNSGGAELIASNRARFRCPVFGRPKYAYVLFFNGSIGKYRLSDGTVALYKESHKPMSNTAFTLGPQDFGPFLESGRSAYVPLRWEERAE